MEDEKRPTKGIRAYDGNGKYVFISYAHKNEDVVLPVIEYLQKRGYNIWFDEGIVPGSEWPDFIADKILNCTCFIGFISPESVASPNCRQEIYLASDEQKDMVNVMLAETELSPGLRMKLSTMQAIEKFRFEEEAQFYIKLLEDAHLAECKDTEEFQVLDDGLLKYNGTRSHIVIPDTITRIGFNAFEGCDSVVSIRIPASVNMIGKYAFYRMKNLQELQVEQGSELFSSSDGILYNLKRSVLLYAPPGKNIGSFTVPQTVKRISMFAFADAALLTEVVMPDSLDNIGERAFEGCKNLIHVRISNSVNRLRPYTFDRCSSLVVCNVPESVRILDDGVFNGCVNLQTVNLPETLTSIGEMCFAYCDSLDEVTIPHLVHRIEPYCFFECLGLRRADTGCVKHIGEYAFKNCCSLEEVKLSEQLTTIARAAFSGCKSLQNVVIPKSVKRIGRYAFDRSDHLSEVIFQDGIEVIETGAFEKDDSLKKVVLPSSIKTVEEGAFPPWTEVVFP